MLDELGNEMEIIMDSNKYDSTMQRMARVFHMSNGNYKNYTPAPTTAIPNSADYNPNPCSITSLSSTITNCFYICNRN